MKPLDMFRHKKVPALTFTVYLVVRQNNITAARGILSDGTRTSIPTPVLASDWEQEGEAVK